MSTRLSKAQFFAKFPAPQTVNSRCGVAWVGTDDSAFEADEAIASAEVYECITLYCIGDGAENQIYATHISLIIDEVEEDGDNRQGMVVL